MGVLPGETVPGHTDQGVHTVDRIGTGIEIVWALVPTVPIQRAIAHIETTGVGTSIRELKTGIGHQVLRFAALQGKEAKAGHEQKGEHSRNADRLGMRGHLPWHGVKFVMTGRGRSSGMKIQRQVLFTRQRAFPCGGREWPGGSDDPMPASYELAPMAGMGVVAPW